MMTRVFCEQIESMPLFGPLDHRPSGENQRGGAFLERSDVGLFSLGRQAGCTVFLMPKVLHDIVRPIGPSPPPGENQRGGVFPERSEVGLFSLGRQAGCTVF